MKRRLALRAEHLTDLTTDELANVAAGQQVTLPTQRCTGYYPSLNAPCPTTDCFTGTTSTS
ncbi:MAG TPA: hypothetical protein VF519_04970 [Mycobacteriales bacterium]|jgi:hypothetical protein